MKVPIIKILLLSPCLLLLCINGFSQLKIVENKDAQALAQKLVGQGVIVSNATLTNTNPIATGFFYNMGGLNIGIDSGIVLTNGKAKTDRSIGKIGLDGNGINIAASAPSEASTSLLLPGDADLSLATGIPISSLRDAVILEFDVVPLGDTLRFKYFMSSEEYKPTYVCTFTDAFALLISGPGITGKQNIALVPGTSPPEPVTIKNVNDLGTCPANPQYYIDNSLNTWFTNDGHTAVFEAVSAVQPCQTYHLKFVIADRGDYIVDSGVFIEAGSLSSDVVAIDNKTPLNENHLPFVAEGCHSTTAIHITRPAKRPFPQTVNITIQGTATNGVDMNLINSTYTIPANDSFVVIPIIPIADMIPEGHERIKIYIASNNCVSNGVFHDSIDIEIRDINTLLIDPGDEALVCKGASEQLLAEGGYLNYSWTGGAGLNNYSIINPIATPVTAETVYICTATVGSCTAKDSILVKRKTLDLVSKKDVYCVNAPDGQITVNANFGASPVRYSINGLPYQFIGLFTNLSAGTYKIRMLDAAFCEDSITVTLRNAFPILVITTNSNNAGCSTVPDGQVSITGIGGNNSYTYSIDGLNYQPLNTFNVFEGSYTAYVKDGNGCVAQQNVSVGFVNTINIDAGVDTIICEGTDYTIKAISNAQTYTWSPAASLNNPALLNPVAHPSVTTKYLVTAKDGRCTKDDSVIIAVRPAPLAVATPAAVTICTGASTSLHGSGGVSYQWTPVQHITTASNIPDPIVKPDVTTTFSLVVKDIHGCASILPATATVNVTPTVKIFAGRDTVIGINQPLRLNAAEFNNSGVNKYTWSPVDYLSDANIANPVAVLPHDMTYVVTGSTPDGCTGTDEITIKAYKGPDIYVPKGFTPNNDGLNDFLRALPVGMKEFHYFTVYNRWGKIVFTTKDYTRGWDGKLNGTELATGTFVWIAKAIDFNGNAVFRKGTVTIIR